MKVVVTGAQGFLGRRLVARLLADGCDVLPVDRVAGPAKDSHVCDLAAPATLFPAKPPAEFALIHLAWDMRREGATRDIQAQQAKILERLLTTWTGRGLKQLIAAGSAEEYGPRGGTIREEDAPAEPLTPYGLAKRAAHDLAVSWAEKNGADLLWMRPFVVYGPGQTGNMAIPYAVRQAVLRERAEFTDGLQERDFIYVDDVVDAFARGLAIRPRGIHTANLGRGEAVALRDIVSEIAGRLNAQDLFVFGARPRRAGEPDTQIADVRRAEELLGWRAAVDWKEGIRRMLR